MGGVPSDHASSHPRPYRHARLHLVPRRHDVRPLRQPGPRRLRPHRPQGARRRHQLHRHRRRVLRRRERGDRRQGPGGRPARPDHPGDQVPLPRGRRTLRAQPRAQHLRLEPPPHHPGVRGQPAPPRHRLDRPLPGAPARLRHRRRRDAWRALRPHPPGQGAGHRLVHVLGRPDRGGPVDGRAARPRALPLRAAALLDLRALHRARGPARLPALRHGRHRVEPAQRRLVEREVPARRRPGRVHERARPPHARAVRSRTSRATPASSISSTSWRSWPGRPACRCPTWPWRGRWSTPA